MASQPERVILTYEHLTHLPSDRNRYELFEGELQVTASPNTAHQTVVTNLMALLYDHVRRRRLGYVFTAPFDVILSEISVVEPDLLFVARANRRIITPQHIRGVPDLVIEVLSPSTALVDREIKKQLYTRYGVGHYWLVDPDRREFVGLTLGEAGYQQTAFARGDASVSAVPFPNLTIQLADLWNWRFPDDE